MRKSEEAKQIEILSIDCNSYPLFRRIKFANLIVHYICNEIMFLIFIQALA